MTSGKLDLSIIIISYNTAQITLNCLESVIKSLQNSKINFEIIVVDNNSTDDTIRQIQNLKIKSPDFTQGLRWARQNDNLKIKIVNNLDNVGFARANNQGVRQADGKYILFLNSDIIVQDQAIPKLFGYFQKNEDKINFLGGKLLERDGNNPQPSCGPFYSLLVVFGWIFLRGDLWNLTRQSPKKTQETDWVSGACILTKKEIFEKLGGFDEKIFMYMDEIDLLYRAKKQNYRVFFYPDARFIHLGSASSGSRTFPVQQAYRGLIYFYQKHHSKMEVKILKFLLKLKATISVFIGRIIRSQYLIKTYEEAYRLVEKS